MIQTTCSLRVRYADTDPMKYVYYGNYARYLEVGRVELFRSIGIPYNEIENNGIWLPVSDYHIKYLKPARYDDLLEITTTLKKLPEIRIEFEYEIYNPKKEILSKASTTLYFYDAINKKITRCPDFIMQSIIKNWKTN
ncbi:MAG: acyl-CoA thioesterase [Bergeyella sp.]|nr:acyl-CoA thioesterase [Bergeyella sp.]